ncbi:MAG: glycosyltransferase, partial [Bacteroidales bacterium]|nr:glycosyltransferase [Bacteroidales bacterium]
FCSRDLETQNIIKYMLLLSNYKLDYKIAGQDGLTVIGSNSVHTAGDLYSINMNSIGSAENKRKKRSLDIALSFIFLISSPIFMWFTKKPFVFIKNMLMVFVGMRSFVGYSNLADTSGLPRLKKGILNNLNPNNAMDAIIAEKSNIIYAKDYSVSRDFVLILKSFKNLGRVSK